MSLAESEVIGIVSGRNLNSSRTELLVDVVISYDGKQSAWNKRVASLFTDEMTVSFIAWVNDNSSIAKHVSGASCCNFNGFISTINGVEKMGNDTEFNLALITWDIK
ncbi:hypothetical protein RRF57_009302 [Xylaria bambusicola]|uniref:Uncharacterized protein n=1 Tax=Xylaria bambusicola TaxID=326684 RepID=A0AAN7UUR4_9PEZI